MPFQPRGPGRPKKELAQKPPRKKRPPLAYRLAKYCQLTGQSRWAVLGQIERGELKVIKKSPGTSPYMIRATEFVRHNFVDSLAELAELEAQLEKIETASGSAADQEGSDDPAVPATDCDPAVDCQAAE